jgi:hypothetical protein
VSVDIDRNELGARETGGAVMDRQLLESWRDVRDVVVPSVHCGLTAVAVLGMQLGRLSFLQSALTVGISKAY